MAKDIEIYVQGNDFIPRMSLANIAKLFAMLGAIDETDLDLNTVVKIMQGVEDESTEELLKGLNEVMNEANESTEVDYCQLKHCGTIYYIKRTRNGDDCSHNMFKVPREYFDDQLLFLKEMIDDHGSINYFKTMERLKYGKHYSSSLKTLT